MPIVNYYGYGFLNEYRLWWGVKMKINRLFEIVYMLLSKENLTAKALAEHFEVSTRTIYRDVETLCEAGFPIYMQQGKGGGITLMEHFVLDKSVLLKEEQEALLSALEVLKVAPQNEEVLRRMSALFGEHTKSWLSVDFEDWGRNSNVCFLQIKEAILQSTIIEMNYYDGQGNKTKRIIAPLQLCFKHRNWYLKAYCYKRKALRLFKLARIKDLEITKKHFEKGLETYLEVECGQRLEDSKDYEAIIVHVQPQLAYRVYEEFEEEQVEKREDGSLKVTLYYPEDEWLYDYLLSFGPYLEVKAPYRIRMILKGRLEKMLRYYRKYDS